MRGSPRVGISGVLLPDPHPPPGPRGIRRGYRRLALTFSPKTSSFLWRCTGARLVQQAPAVRSLEVGLADVLLREHDGRPEQDLVRCEHLDLTEPTGLEGARLGQLVVDLGVGHVHRKVSEIDGVPEDELLYDAGIDVRLHLVRGGEAGDRHFSAAADLLDGLRRHLLPGTDPAGPPRKRRRPEPGPPTESPATLRATTHNVTSYFFPLSRSFAPSSRTLSRHPGICPTPPPSGRTR